MIEGMCKFHFGIQLSPLTIYRSLFIQSICAYQIFGNNNYKIRNENILVKFHLKTFCVKFFEFY